LAGAPPADPTVELATLPRHLAGSPPNISISPQNQGE